MQFLLFSSYPFLRKAQPFGKQPELQEPAFADSSGRYDDLVFIRENLASMGLVLPVLQADSFRGLGPVLHSSLPAPLPIVWKPFVGTFSPDAGSFLRLVCCCASGDSLIAKQQKKSCCLRRAHLASFTRC